MAVLEDSGTLNITSATGDQTLWTASEAGIYVALCEWVATTPGSGGTIVIAVQNTADDFGLQMANGDDAGFSVFDDDLSGGEELSIQVSPWVDPDGDSFLAIYPSATGSADIDLSWSVVRVSSIN